MSRAWTHRVVKSMRGMQGDYFDFSTAATFDDEEEARVYAERFAREQGASRVYGARISVRERRGDKSVVTYRSEDYLAQSTTGGSNDDDARRNER